MKIEIDPTTEQPATLRALAAMLVTLAGGEARVTLDLKLDEAQIDAMVAKVAAEVKQEHAAEAYFKASENLKQIDDSAIDAAESEMLQQFAAETRDQVAAVKHAAAVFAGTAASYFTPEEMAEPVRVVPLPPPAPPIAAAALFSTVHAAPLDGVMTNVPPPPVPSVPAPPAPSAPAPVTDPALDVNGVAWDAAKHSSTKAKNVDGTWRARRNLGAAVVPPVAPPPASGRLEHVAPPPPPAINPVAPQASNVGASGQFDGKSVPPPPLPIPQPVPPPPVPGLNPFPRMMRTITDNLTAGRITKPQVNEVLAAHGVMDPGQIAILATLPDTAAKVTAALVALGAQNV